MSLTDAFIARLEDMKAGDRARLRQLAGQPLDRSVPGFDLFTGLWWPLRQKSPQAPERRTAWLVAKLYGAFPIPNTRASPGSRRATLPAVLGRAEARQKDRERFRQRFDALILAPLSAIEPPLRWALSIARKAVAQGHEPGMDWVDLLDDLHSWDRGHERGRAVDIPDQWAREYLSPFEGEGDRHVD
ncbi:MAG TPA: type I-E CRISPR-associated protein Cse2/CasB [Planctomycetota bacterium]|nr:type I-E CRISPR-associated protein Cse2/CasB [Planctomycetota bacterium]